MRRGRVCVTQALLCGRGSASSWGVWEVVAEGGQQRRFLVGAAQQRVVDSWKMVAEGES